MVVSLFLVVPWVCLRFVIVVFPDHTHLLFLAIPEEGCSSVVECKAGSLVRDSQKALCWVL